MPNRPLTCGDIALIRIGDLYASVVVRQIEPVCAACGHDRLLVELLSTGATCLLTGAAVVGLCDNEDGCYGIDDRCTHCGQPRGDEHLPGCPHDVVDECDNHPAEEEQEMAGPVYTTSDGKPVVEGLKVFTNDARWGTVTRVAVWPADRDPTDAWHHVTYPDGGVGRYNRERLTTRESRGW